MSFDLNVLVLNQKEPVALEYSTPIKLRNEVQHAEYQRYHSIWPFVTAQKGIWYNLVAKDRNVRNAYKICKSDEFAERENYLIPYWLDDKATQNNCTPLVIADRFREDFERVLRTLISGSPNKTILFLARYQATDLEIITGVLELDLMLKMLDNRKILFNICYIIRIGTES